MTIAEKIAYIVKYFESGSKKDFARKIGTPNGNSGLIGDWISGKAKPGHDYRVKICEAYADDGVTPDWLNNDDATTLPLPAELVAPATTDHLSPISERLLAALENAQKDGADKMAAINKAIDSHKELTSSHAKLIDTTAQLANTNAKIASDNHELLKRFFTSKAEQEELFPPKGKASGRRSASAT